MQWIASVIMQATLALAASFWTASLPAANQTVTWEGYHQKGQAISSIRTYLNTHVAGRPVTNEIIAAIACLGNVEVISVLAFVLGRSYMLIHPACRRSREISQPQNMHISAVRDLIVMRGGRKTVIGDFYLCRCINW